MTTNVRNRNRRTQSQPGILDHISQGVSSLLDRGTLLSPNHDIYVAQRELDEYKRNNPTHSVANDPDGVIRGLLERQAGGVSLDPENKGVVGLMGKVAKKVKGGVTAEEVLALSRKNKPKHSFREWDELEKPPTPNLLDFSSAKPTFPDHPGPQRYIPTSRSDISRITDLTENENVERLATKFAKKGTKILPESWYSTSPLYKIYVEELGEKAAKKKFIRDMELFAATSPQHKVPENIKVGSLYQHYAAQGIPIPEKIRKASEGYAPDDIFPPPGYGHLVQKNHRTNAENVISGEGMDIQKNPKPLSFAANFAGNEKPLTADIHFIRAMGMFSEDPRFLTNSTMVNVIKDGKVVQVKNKQGRLVNKKKEINPQKLYKKGELTMKEAQDNPDYWVDTVKNTEYAKLEEYAQKIAKKLGMSTARFQEALWLGAGKLTGLMSPPEPFIKTLEKRIKYTAEQLGADPDTVMRQYIRGEIPLAEVGEDQQSRYGGLLA